MTKQNGRPLALIIIDGWGSSSVNGDDPFEIAHTPNYDEICRTFPKTNLISSGPRVGLPVGVSGNPDAGHLNIGGGRVMQTDGFMIADAIESGKFFENEILKMAMKDARSRNSTVHFIGLLSDAGIHSSTETLFALLRFAKQEELPQVFIHCILDGRDVPSKTADAYVEALEVKMEEIGIGQIASMCGRFFAMDTEENWERTARAYTMLVHSEGEGAIDAKTAIRNSFLRGYSDEFLPPVILEKGPGIPRAAIRDGDLIVFFNHRADGMRQLVSSMAAAGEKGGMPFNKPKVEIVCLTEYEAELGLQVAFPRAANRNFIGEVLEKNGYSDLRITESERSLQLGLMLDGKAGGQPFEPRQIVLKSPEPSNRRSKPEMCSFKITDALLQGLESARGTFFVNIPAPALSAETGDAEKTIEAIQYVDTCLGGILEKVREMDAVAILTSSHSGYGRPGQESRAENYVPLHIIDGRSVGTELRDGGSLEDVAPTILGLLGIEKPGEMTGSDLRIS